MFKRNLWKLTLSLAIVLWAVSSLLPLQDRPFDNYIKGEATAKPAEFAGLMKEASDRVASKQSPSVFAALKQIAKERKIDLTTFFPELNLGDVRNVEKRNALLLDHLLQQSKGRLQLGLDLKGGIAFTLEADEKALASSSDDERHEKLAKAIEIIGDRVNGLGVAEPVIRPVGDNRIEVQLPGVNTKDNPEVVDSVKKPARLDFRLVHRFQRPDTTTTAEAPAGYEPMTVESESRTGETFVQEYYVKRIPEMTGEGVSDAFPRSDEYGRWEVILRFTSAGSKRFAEVTRAIADENQRSGNTGQLAIVLDGKLYSAPTVRDEIDSETAQITGSFTRREAEELANVLNNPLDLPLQIKESYEVGPSLAEDAIGSGVKASVIGAALVAGFMILYYTWAGLIAVFSVSINVLMTLGVLASLGATMTMPGIAGIVLTVGMAVDAHILIFERMREELKLGKSLTAAFHAGHEKAFSAIVDANVTTLIASALMIGLGTGPVKGFGITLTIGIFATMFTALVVSRMLLEFAIDSGAAKKMVTMDFLKSPVRDFLKFSKPAFIASWIIVLIGVGGVALKGHAIYGIDFIGGDEVSLTFKDRIDPAKLRTALEDAKLGEVSPLYQSALAGSHEILKVQTEAGKGDAAVAALTQAFPQAGFSVEGKSTIGPSVGKEIQWNALMMIGLSIVGIMLYVAFRFEFGFGMGAVVSTVHDVLMTIGIFVLTDRQFTAPMVAAILLIVGYSINDTIVVFDRIREELRVNPTAGLRDVINSAIEKVFTRSLLTSLTTFLAALALYLVGGGVINDLAFTFMVGIVTGTFSSIFIASPVFYWWHKGDRRDVEKHEHAAPTYEWTGASKASQ